MEDEKIIDLYFKRDETAITETAVQYGAFCLKIAINFLSNIRDAEECVNETFYQAWNLIPPERPNKLQPWLGRITRNIAIKLWQKNHAEKRYNAMDRALCDLEDTLPSSENLEHEIEDRELGATISKWLRSLTLEDRQLFVRRYWYGISLNELAREIGTNANSLAQKMHRLRIRLKSFLEQEDLFYG